MIKINRRNLLVGMGLSGVSAAMSSRFSVAQGKKHLKILIFRGSGFIGSHIVREASARGHEVTLFNCRRTNRFLQEQVSILKRKPGCSLPGINSKASVASPAFMKVLNQPPGDSIFARETVEKFVA